MLPYPTFVAMQALHDHGHVQSVARLRRGLTPTGTLVIVGGEGDRWIGGIQRQLWAGVLSPFVPQQLTAFEAGDLDGRIVVSPSPLSQCEPVGRSART